MLGMVAYRAMFLRRSGGEGMPGIGPGRDPHGDALPLNIQIPKEER